MPKSTARKIFVNLAVRDLERAKAFFSALGFDYDPKFTDENAACMVVSDEAYVMLGRPASIRVTGWYQSVAAVPLRS